MCCGSPRTLQCAAALAGVGAAASKQAAAMATQCLQHCAASADGGDMNEAMKLGIEGVVDVPCCRQGNADSTWRMLVSKQQLQCADAIVLY